MEIKNAIDLAESIHLNFFAYRLPGKTTAHFGASAKTVDKPCDNSFAISTFDGRTSYIPDGIPIETLAGNKATASADIPLFESTSKEQYLKSLNRILDHLNANGGKIVLSRVIKAQRRSESIGNLFCRLCETYPTAYVFCYYTELHGGWIGASPELLLKAENGIYSTMALAGTRPSGSIGIWDEKNITEQKIVTDYITEVFKSHGLHPIVATASTRKAGPVEHLCTPISCEMPPFKASCFENLLSDLSPTPALCGYPKSTAMQLLKEVESHDRECYGGFTGPYHSTHDFSFFVNLRSLKFTDTHYNIYVGGGITPQSEPEKEWQETEIKATTLLKLI